MGKVYDLLTMADEVLCHSFGKEDPSYVAQ